MRPTLANAGAGKDKNDYQKTFEQFVECEEPGVHENFINGVKIAEPMKGNSSESGDVLISLKKYIIHMKESQIEINYIMDEILIPECLIDVLPENAEKNDDYKKFYEQIVECMKPGVHANFVDGFEIAELVRYNTLKAEDEQTKLKEYIDCKKEGQNDNYDITGEILIPECLNFTKNIMRVEKNVGKSCRQAVPDPHQQRRQEQCTRQQDEVKGPHGGAVERKCVM